MVIQVNELSAKTILSKSGIPGADYCINPYIGCAHACKYCYAEFMKKYTGHIGSWGSFVDIKVNAPDILKRQMQRAKKGPIMISSVTDAYQPLEAKYKLTRRCLEEILPYQFPVDILTKSPLVLRDMDILRKFKDLTVGFTVTTDREDIRKIFEPHAPPVPLRINALRMLHNKGLRTYAFIGPVLPMDPDSLAEQIIKYVDFIYIDRMNYISKTGNIYRQKKLAGWLEDGLIQNTIMKLKRNFDKKDILIC